MKQINHLINSSSIALALLLCTISCDNNEELEFNNSHAYDGIAKVKNAVYAFSNREDIASAVNSEMGAKTRSINITIVNDSIHGYKNQIEGSNILLLTDKVLANDPILDEVSDEEKKIILEEGMTYYDMYGCEDYIPSEGFAKLLNSKREIQLNDSLYKITEYGTLRTVCGNSANLDSAYNILKRDTTFLVVKKDFTPILKDVEFHPYNKLVVFDNDDSSNGIIATRSSASDIPTNNFNHYTAESKTYLGKVLGAILGDRSVKHHEFMSKRRVNGSLYSYNYLVYHEAGSFVSLSKKRGGFFKFINGWKDITADELFMQLKGIVLELDIDVPQGYLPSVSSNSKPIVDSYSDLNIQGIDKVIHKTVNIFGYNIKEKDMQKYIGMGAKQLYKCLKNEVGNPEKLREFYGTSENIPAVRILTPKTVYIIIPDTTYNPKSEKKIRTVFSAGVKFYISISNGKLSWSDFVKSLQGTKKMPVKKLIGGEVLLAGKLENKWGGMYIKKEK